MEYADHQGHHEPGVGRPLGIAGDMSAVLDHGGEIIQAQSQRKLCLERASVSRCQARW